MMFAVRVSLPDRPGSLAELTTTLAAHHVDVVSLDVVERSGAVAVDDLCLRCPMLDMHGLRRCLEAVDGVVVEAAKAVTGPPDRTAGLALAVALAAMPGEDERMTTLVQGVPEALWAQWALAVEATGNGACRLVASTAAAPLPARMELPWLPLHAPRRLESAAWMPPAWRLRAGGGSLSLAAAPLGHPGRAVLVGRTSGARFLDTELRQLALLTEAAAVTDAAGGVACGATL